MKYLISRILQVIPVLIIATIIVFIAIRLAPGDPALIKLGPKGGNDPAAVEKVRHEMGLDKLMVTQYFYWIKDISKGDFGVSLMNGVSALKIVKSRIPASFELILISIILSILISIILGVIAGVKNGTLVDKTISSISTGLISIPAFWVALLLITVFAIKFRVLPASGYVPFLENPTMNLKLILMPAISLTLVEIGVFTRFIRGGIIDVMGSNYIRTARAKGVKNIRVYIVHAFKNILVTVVTVVGLETGALIGGTLLVEQIFGWSGIGWLLLKSILNRDYSIVQCIVFLIVVFYVFINLIIDIVYVVIDPRVKF
ncbi:MAG: ABC transporter permease [Actinobacteria bacterium]|nr:ABC transporter permease [Actinomycetota bacterium]